MKICENGIEREVDQLGRIVLPMEFRKKLGIERNTRVSIYMHDDTVLVKAFEKSCLMCKSKSELNTELGICRACIEKVKKVKT